MIVEKNKVVSIEYSLKNSSGELIDTSDGSGPFSFIHGIGSVIPGLEKALEGKKEGESFQIIIPPEDAYGNRDDSLMQTIPRNQFAEDVGEITPGMKFQAQTEHGVQIITVANVQGDDITIDVNHPLAGETLSFDVKILDIREATEEELAHGHAHGAHSHPHD